jgi:hypothetical protein
MSHPVWITPSGSLGTYPSSIPMLRQLEAQAELPAVTLTYSLLSGTLPMGITLSQSGVISGTPSLQNEDTQYDFVVRATDNFQNVKDRYFFITISGVSTPQFTLPSGLILSTNDSIWRELPITYSNPISTNPVSIRIVQGELPPGLEINNAGLIRGYPNPPTNIINLPLVLTTATATSLAANTITVLSTTGFAPGRPIIFSGSLIGGVTAGVTYYVKSVINATTFTISTTQDGPTYNLSNDSGVMDVTLPTQSVGQPVVRTYSFSLKLESPLGNDLIGYLITVTNQNTPAPEGPGELKRFPTIYNTRPPSYNLTTNSEDYGYYVLPTDTTPEGLTYPPTEFAYIGKFYSGDYFAFKIIGHDFDNDALNYEFQNLPAGLTGDTNTGWITGYPSISDNSISQFTFSVRVYKASFPSYTTPFYNFSYRLTNGIDGDIIWITDSDLGIIDNGTISLLSVLAESNEPTEAARTAVNLQYRVVAGDLPPNLTLLSNGQITGIVAYQPTDTFLDPDTETEFNFTINAYSENYPLITSNKTFTLTVKQTYTQPTDNLYIKCTPSLADRELIKNLLTNETLIPNEYLYRPEDQNFGKAQAVVYAHAYGIYASNLDEYILAVQKNHYWRNITLGEIKTAVAKNELGEVIYEVVYSEIIDNLINPEGISVSKEIFWPRLIDLNQGGWYTSSTNIYTSYIYNIDTYLLSQRQKYILTQNIERILLQQGEASFYTSLTPGYARNLYPNSLPNMRDQVAEVLGQDVNSSLLPLWMTSQQADGSTLGFTPAWVICYTKPGFSASIKRNIETLWVDPIGNLYRLNLINFTLDRFTVDKVITYDYDKTLSPPAWTGLPSATPVPDPLDSQNFYVLFPRKTILPDIPQYY